LRTLPPLLPLTLCLLLAPSLAGGVSVLETRVAASTDDAEEIAANGHLNLTSGDLELVRDGSTDQVVGIRFPGQAIPADAVIRDAWLQFEADGVRSEATTVTLRADRTQASPTFSTASGNVSLRPRTSASVAWTLPPWTVIGEAGPAQRTPGLAAIVQERVNATDWLPGDALTFILTGSGRRTARAFDGVPSGAPLLHVEFDPPANYNPVISIASPLEGTTTFPGTAISFSASAADVESNDVSPSILWTSSLDGMLGMGPSFSRSDLTVGTHTLTVSASDGQGGFSARTRRLTVFEPGNQVLAAGDIGSCTSAGDEATGALLESLGGTILGLGDFAYPDGSASDFANCLDPSWGPHKARMRPAAGNHEYTQTGAPAYFAYFGAAAGSPTHPWHSFDLAGWHVVALDSNCGRVGGCGAGSPQGQWLEADLAANSKPCTLAFFHHPRFSSGIVGVDDDVLPFWETLYAHGVDVILNGHDHAYERFARVGPAGLAEPLRGIRSFISGSGGVGLHGADEVEPNSEVRDETTYGVLRLTLAPTSYAWEFLGAGPGTFTDSGSEECVYSAPAVTITSPAGGAVFPAGASVTLSGSASDLEQGSLSSSLVWTSSRDGVLGSGASLSRVLSSGGHVLTASASDETGLSGSAKVSVTVLLPPGASCGIGPELAPLLALVGAAAAWDQRSSRGTSKRAR
jgi:hypothetical protein